MSINLNDYVDSLRGTRPTESTLGGGVSNDFKPIPTQTPIIKETTLKTDPPKRNAFSRAVRDSWRIAWELPEYAQENGLEVLLPAFTQLRERVKMQNKTEYTDYLLGIIETQRKRGVKWEEIANRLNARGLYPLRSEKWEGTRLKSWSHRLLNARRKAE
jgi:hypothetical protein|tara:strand:- start:130 stop:606 length:477 start_codon:yes stop_codon:yes gene_type:complete